MQLSNPKLENSLFFRRIKLSVIIIIVTFLLLLIRILNLQFFNYDYYSQESLDNQSLFLYIPPERGNIFDRNGRLIAGNKLVYQLSITPENTTSVSATLAQLKQDGIISDQQISRYRKRKHNYQFFQDIPIANINEASMSLVLSSQSYKGLDIQPIFKRTYTDGSVFSHIIGYVGSINKTEQEQFNLDEYKGINQIGKTGIEKYYQSRLKGLAGRQSVIRNANGRNISTRLIKAAEPGEDLHLSVDYELQKKALDLLQNKRGAIVMMLVKTSEVLVLASAPSFDANAFIGGISQKDYNTLQNNTNEPLFNRAIQGSYPPGSTIKPFVALAALESDATLKDHKVFCKGVYYLPSNDHQYRDWKPGGHGLVDIKQSIAQSCDVFFYDIARKIGIDTIFNQLQQFNFGSKTGIDLMGEVSGVLPSAKWKLQTKGEPWYLGETIIVGIGQGFMTVTPLQLALANVILANRGKLVMPKLLKYSQNYQGKIWKKPEQFQQLIIKDINHYAEVIEGMRQAIYGPLGTARRLSKDLSYTVAGKTGTAQVFSLARDESYVEQNLPENLRDHALFSAFAPIQNPEVAIAVIVENAGSGSAYAAPIAKKMLDAYFETKAL